MENGDLAELPREEALTRLYQLARQLTLDEVLELEGLPLLPVDFCDDCHAHCELRRYGSVATCDRCTLSRMKVRAIAAARAEGLSA